MADHFSSPSLLRKPENNSTIIMLRRFRPEVAKYVSFGVGQAWKSWPSVSITLYNLPNTINTHELWRSFTIQGNIVSIDIFEDRHGHRISKGRIRFWYGSFLFLSFSTLLSAFQRSLGTACYVLICFNSIIALLHISLSGNVAPTS